MRVTVILLFAGILCAMADTGHAQNARVTLSKRNATLREVLNEIEKQTDYLFIYNNQVNANEKVSLRAKHESVSKVLSSLLKNKGLSYSMEGNHIILSSIEKARAAAGAGKQTNAARQEKKQITGIIVDADGIPVIGANIVEAGTTNGTISDIDGRFALQVNQNASIRISYIGYLEQNIDTKGQTDFGITLIEDTQSLEELVVIGYGSTTRKNITTSISSVKPDAVGKSAFSNVSNLLLGRAAGVQGTVNNSQPDGKINISVRGGGTPIYVVDGIVMPAGANELGSSNSNLPSGINRSGLNGLNPDDIESIEILKDASAAIYGIGASDGVILITTKKGKSGKPQISYTGSGSYITNQRTVTSLNARQYMQTYNAFDKEQYLYNNAFYPYGTATYDGGWTPIYTDADIASNTIDTNWSDEVLRNGYINNQNITIQGGNDKIRYYLGLNYFDQQGNVYNSDMKRYVVHSNVSTELLPFLRLNSTINYNNNKYQNSTVGNDNAGGHQYGAYQAAVSYPPIMSIKDENGDFTAFGNIPNPSALSDIDDHTEKNTIYANFGLELDIIKNILSLKGTYGMNKELVDRKYYIPSYVQFNQDMRSRGQVSNASQLNQTFEATVNYRRQFGKNLTIDAVAGMGKYLVDYYSYWIYYTDANDIIANDDISLSTGTKDIHSSRTASEKRSQFVRASFDIMDKYVISATLRRDGTDKFFPSKKYALFPSVSAAWKITSEKFMEDADWINLLKLRVSYGITGRDNLGSSLYGVYTTYGMNVSFDDGASLYTPYILSGDDYDNVTWEKTVMKNLGLDFSIFKDRIWGSIDVYRNDETNQLSYSPSSWKNMFASVPVNSGHYKREGFDINLNSRNIYTKKLTWETSLNISRNKTLWIERTENYDYESYQVHKNEPVSYLYYYETAGIINSSMSNMPESQASLDETWQKPGIFIIKDQNNDGIINEDDIMLENTGDPKLYLGLGNSFKWKNFDLDIYMYGRFGFSRYNYALGYGNYTNLLNSNRNIGTAVYKYYNSETNPEATLPGIAYSKVSSLPGGVGTNNCREDASFVRVRNITLGYTFDMKKIAFLADNVRSLRVYTEVQNPFLFTKFSIADPEITLGGGQSTVVGYPQTRT